MKPSKTNTATAPVSNTKKAVTKVKKVVKNAMDQVKRSALFYKNPKTGNLVCYQRAIQLHILSDKNIESGILNPKTGRLITDVRKAKQMKLISSADLKAA